MYYEKMSYFEDKEVWSVAIEDLYKCILSVHTYIYENVQIALLF